MSKEQVLKYADQFDKLEHALSKLATLDCTIHEAMVLDELTDPLLSMAGGLANHYVSQLGIDPIYAAPNVSIRSMVATEVTASTNKAFEQLLPVRNRAVVGLLTRLASLVNEQLRRLDTYTGSVFSRVRDAMAYGVGAAGLSNTRIISDDQMRKLLGYAIKHSDHDKVVEMISWQFGEMLGSVHALLKDQATFEYLEANANRLHQGGGFAPVPRGTQENDNPQMKYFTVGFNGESIIGYFKEGLSICKPGDYDSNNPEVAILEQPTMQDVYSTLEDLNVAIRRVVENVADHSLFPDEYVSENICTAVTECPLHAKQYNTYYGDTLPTPEDVEVMANRLAAIRLGQLSYVFYVLDNILNALPVLMNYFIRDKIKS